MLEVELLKELDGYINSSSSIKPYIDRIYQVRQDLDDYLTDEQRLEYTNKIKSKVQCEAANAIKANGGKGLVVMATGAGKSKVAVDLAVEIAGKKPNSRGIISVPTEKLRDQNWCEEFHKWNAHHIYENNIERTCYASLHTYENEEFDYMIMDEAHNATELNTSFFSKNKVQCIVGLTATKPRNILKNELLKKIGLEVVYELTLDECVKLGIVAPYDITIVTMQLDNTVPYIKAGKKDKPFYTTEKRQYNYLTQKCLQAPSKANYLNRMRFIYNLKTKTDAANNLLEFVIPKDLRTVIFCGSIEQAIAVNDRRFFSKPSIKKTDNAEKKQKIQAILDVYEGDAGFNDFKEGKINRLSCVNSLNEGQNLPDVDCGLVVQLNSNDLNLIQRLGRFLRFRLGHIGKLIILCVDDSVDKDWVNAATKNLDSSKITVVELSRVRMGIETITF